MSTKEAVSNVLSQAQVMRMAVERPKIHAKAFHARHLQLLQATLDGSLIVVSGLMVFLVSSARAAHSAHLFVMLHDFLGSGMLGATLVYAVLTVTACNRQHLYSGTPYASSLDETIAVVKAVVLASLALMSGLFLIRDTSVSPHFVASCGMSACTFILIGRFCRRSLLRRHVLAGRAIRNVLIVGADATARALRLQIETSNLGWNVKGFIASHRNGNRDVLGTPDEIFDVVRSQFIDEIFVTSACDTSLVRNLAIAAPRQRVTLRAIPDLFGGFAWRAPVGYVGDFPVMTLHWEADRSLELHLKRLLDLVLSAVGLIAASPFLALIALAIKLDSPGPIFYGARRIGQKGRVFNCWKFRTMVKNADELLDQIRHLNERDGALFKVANDPRITSVGRFLRKYSIDEIPQLVNVIRGDMSLVGPRPPRPDEYMRYEPEHLRRLDVMPGITGLWQVTSRQDPSFQSYLQRDIEYIESWSLWMDVKILFRTVPAVLKGTGT